MPNGHNGGYAVIVQAAGSGWQWVLTDLDARIAASGEAGDQETAWRTGMFAAGAIESLQRVGRRGF